VNGGSAVPRCLYQRQDTTLTLAEGLEEYYRANAGAVLRPDDLPDESRRLFKSHDICHVIFGLDTTLADETMADMRTLLSCDVGLRRYARYLATNQDVKAVFAELGYGRAVLASILAIPRVLRALRENSRMTRKWPWEPPASFFDRTLSDLRAEYGIRVI
jgi:hypothetical protein